MKTGTPRFQTEICKECDMLAGVSSGKYPSFSHLKRKCNSLCMSPMEQDRFTIPVRFSWGCLFSTPTPLGEDQGREQVQVLNVAIVGGGPGCKAIMEMIFAEKLSELQMKLIGVACTNPDAVGYRYAQEKGIYTTRNYRELYNLKELNMIIELTGHGDVSDEISRSKPDHVRLIDHVAARLFWDIFQFQEERIEERGRAEEELRKAHGELERRVKERTYELLRSNELLRREIAERERVEEKLRTKNEELKNLTRFVSHELRTPIIGIQGFASRLLRKYQHSLGGKGLKYLQQILASACRMEKLVSDLLSFPTTGQVKAAFEEVPSSEIIRGVMSGLQGRLKEKGIKVKVPSDLPTIWCDEGKIRQVFENLLVNAIKFMGDTKNGSIKIGYEDMGRSHRFHVRDNGIGIDVKHHRRIFEMFQRLGEVDDKEGTGLGLAIVQSIVSNHGGKVWVESKKGRGATFHVDLPKAV